MAQRSRTSQPEPSFFACIIPRAKVKVNCFSSPAPACAALARWVGQAAGGYLFDRCEATYLAGELFTRWSVDVSHRPSTPRAVGATPHRHQVEAPAPSATVSPRVPRRLTYLPLLYSALPALSRDASSPDPTLCVSPSSRYQPPVLSNVIEVRLVHPLNAHSPMLVTLLGMVIEVRLSHPQNAHSPMLVTPAGMVIEVRLVHP